MKNSKYILLVVALVVVLLIGLMKNNKDVAVAPTDNSIDICYIWNTEAGDSASLRMNFSGNGGVDVKGSLSLQPAEKDTKSGTFVGIAGPVDQTSMSRMAKLVWNASGEGVTNTEELYIKFGEGNAAPGFGNMQDDGHGVYVYADPNAVTYPINFQQTDCSDPALK
jgi:hypothetical protein